MSTDHRLRSKLLRISSADKDIGDNNDFTVFLKQSLGTRSTGVKLVSASFYNVFENIRSVTNSFTFTEAAQVQQTVTVTPGHYTATELFAALKVAVDAVLVAGSVAFTLVPVTYKVLITFSGTTASVELDTISRALGFSTARTTGATHLADYTPKLGGLDELFISSRALASSNLVDAKDQSHRSIIAVVPNTQPFLSQTFWEADSNDATIAFQYPRDISTVDLRFENSLGQLVDLQEQHVKLVFRVFY